MVKIRNSKYKRLDFSQDFKNIMITKNDAILLNDLLHTIPVDIHNLTYQCAKSLIIKLNKEI